MSSLRWCAFAAVFASHLCHLSLPGIPETGPRVVGATQIDLQPEPDADRGRDRDTDTDRMQAAAREARRLGALNLLLDDAFRQQVPQGRLRLPLEPLQADLAAQQAIGDVRREMPALQLRIMLSNGQLRTQIVFGIRRDGQHEQIAERVVAELVQCAERRATARIAQLDGPLQLTDTQRAKLMLAARSDARRASILIRQWLEANVDAQDQLAFVRQPGAATREIDADIQSCIDGEHSLFNKVFDTVLSAEQRQAMTEHHLRWFVDRFPEPDVRNSLHALLLRYADRASVVSEPHEFCSRVARRVPPEELASVLDEKQRAVFEIVLKYSERQWGR